ncbi:hypothetical protein SprV_0301256000 [Sparganum proliferum]
MSLNISFGYLRKPEKQMSYLINNQFIPTEDIGHHISRDESTVPAFRKGGMTSYNSPDASNSLRENSETSFDETGGEITSSSEEEDSVEDPSRLTFETPQTPWERFRRNVSRPIFTLPILPELKALYQLATAVFLTSLGQNCLFFESNMICGSLGKEALAAVGLANSVIYALGHVLGLGLVTACDTLFSQLYGSPSRHRIGMLLQKSVMIISLVPLLCSTYFLNLEPLLLMIGTEPDVAKSAAEYVAWFYPGLFFCFNSYILSRYLQAQDKAFVPLTAALLANAVNLGLNYLLVIRMQLGLKMKKFQKPSSPAGLPQYRSQFPLGFSWYFKQYTPLGWTNIPKPGGLTSSAPVEFSFGFGVALSIRIGQALGGGKADAAKHAYAVALMNFVLLLTSITLITYFVVIPVAHLYTNDKNILEELDPVVPYLLVLIPLDGYAAHISGVLRGCGLQARGAVGILVSYYGVCTPLYFILGFMLHMGITGLWLALVITLAFLSFIFLIMSSCLNWNTQATKVQAVIGNAIESAIFERTLGRPSEMAPLLRRRLLSQPPQNISVILENSEGNVARSIEPTNERSLYSYTTNTNVVMRSSFIPMHGPAPMVFPLPTRVSRRKFKKILLLRFAILVVCLLFLIGSILTHIFIPALFPVWFPQDEGNKTLALMFT